MIKRAMRRKCFNYEEIITYILAASLAWYVGKISKLCILCGSI